MSFEQVKIIDEVEESKCFEDLAYTRDFGAVDTLDAKKIIKEHFQYWRLPTVSEFYALRKQNKKNFFNQKSYWGKMPVDRDVSGDIVEVRFGLLGSCGWFFPDENNAREKHLVLFKKETVIEDTEKETEKIMESYPF